MPPTVSLYARQFHAAAGRQRSAAPSCNHGLTVSTLGHQSRHPSHKPLELRAAACWYAVVSGYDGQHITAARSVPLPKFKPRALRQRLLRLSPTCFVQPVCKHQSSGFWHQLSGFCPVSTAGAQCSSIPAHLHYTAFCTGWKKVASTAWGRIGLSSPWLITWKRRGLQLWQQISLEATNIAIRIRG